MNRIFSGVKSIGIYLGMFYYLYKYPVFNFLKVEPKINLFQKIKAKMTTLSLNDIAFALQFGANDPCEDRFCLREINLFKNGLFMSVLDGHGGYHLSEYANMALYTYFLDAYQKEKDDLNEERRIITSLKLAFAKIEKEFLILSYQRYLNGEGRLGTVGSCALTAIIANNKLYVASLGDSKARLFSGDSRNYLVKKISKVFNARKKDEQKRLKNQWPNDEEIYKCHKDDSKACYVKGRLQPTRSLGDYHLKYQEFNNHNYKVCDHKKYKKEIANFDGPYITSIPDIQVIKLTRDDKYLVLGSDGLWDFIKSVEVKKLIPKLIDNKASLINDNNMNNAEKISYGLMTNVLEEAAKQSNISVKQLIDMPFGSKLRKIRDDITIILCDLTKLKF